MTSRHGDAGGGLCWLPHYCPNCEEGIKPCLDLFEHPICGLVACATEERAKTP